MLEWNKAFERIGFKDAIRVEVQPDDADFDTLDFGRASIRWMTNAAPSFGAIGPSHVDPRSGEILDADIGIESLSSRTIRVARAQILTGDGVDDPLGASARSTAQEQRCSPARPAVQLRRLGRRADRLRARRARGARRARPRQPRGASSSSHAYLKDATMHEVGHTLGLRHNFRSSRVYTLQQLADPAFTREQRHRRLGDGVRADQPHAADEPRERRTAAPFSDTLGPVRLLGHRVRLPAAARRPDGRGEGARWRRSPAAAPSRCSPTAPTRTTSSASTPSRCSSTSAATSSPSRRKRIAIAQDLLKRQETRQLRPDQDYNLLRRSVSFALRDVARAANVLARQIGGVRTVRDAPGTGRDPLTPVPVAEQREALDLITGSLLAADSLRVSPALQRKLGTDFSERCDALRGGEGSAQTDYSPSEQVLGMQRALLAALMSDTVATRLLESSEKAPGGTGRALRMSELYARLSQAVWSELDGGGDIAPLRREVQRDHINRIAARAAAPRRGEPCRHAQRRPRPGQGAARAPARRQPARRPERGDACAPADSADDAGAGALGPAAARGRVAGVAKPGSGARWRATSECSRAAA